MPHVTHTVTETELPLLTQLARIVEDDLAERLGRLDLPENLLSAVRYSVLDGGKRLRPVLTLLSCDAVLGRHAPALPAAAAIELIHCFSLVHDDLPAMDDDALRRGRPTLHIEAGEAMAILGGDIMVSLAFEIINQVDLPGERRSELTIELARATSAMIVGQVHDTLGGFPADLSDEQKLERTHRNKTGALLRCSCRLGAICASADENQLRALTDYGEAIGLMYQIVDDLLDITQTSEHLGKATGKDLSAGKITYPGLHGIEESRKEIDRLHDIARKALTPLGPAAGGLADLCDFMAVRSR